MLTQSYNLSQQEPDQKGQILTINKMALKMSTDLLGPHKTKPTLFRHNAIDNSSYAIKS